MKLINYLPPVLRDVPEFQAINNANDPEISLAWEALDQVMSNQFLSTSDEGSIRVWEKALGLKPKTTDSLEDRRFGLSIRFNNGLPYTYTKMIDLLNQLCGSGNFKTVLSGYDLVVKVGLSSSGAYESVNTLLQQMVPANINLQVYLMWATHEQLAAYTHEQLSAYTHEQIQKELSKEEA